MLEKEFDFFKKNQQSLVEKYKGQYIVIIGNEVIGSYPSNEIALYYAKQKYDIGTFLIQHCIEGENAYTCRIHTLFI